jgi:putative hydrolase of the HAD superfamily
MIKAVFFDLDDTLLWDSKSIQSAFEETCKYACTRVNIDGNKLEEEVRTSAKELYSSYETFEFTRMIGINPFEGLWGDFQDDHHEQFSKMKEIVPAYREEAWSSGLKRLGVNSKALGKELAERFRVERKNHPFVYPDTFHVLNLLRDDYVLVLLTNGSPQLQHIKLQMTEELVPYFEEIIISGAIGKGKPDTAMFLHALDRLSLKKEEVIMVGDNLMTDILGANRTGIRNVWINRHDRDQGDIRPDYEIKELSELLDILKQL